MTKIRSTTDPDEQFNWMLDYTDQHATGLTEWEADFIESLMQQRRAGRSATDKQRAILEIIYDEKA